MPYENTNSEIPIKKKPRWKKLKLKYPVNFLYYLYDFTEEEARKALGLNTFDESLNITCTELLNEKIRDIILLYFRDNLTFAAIGKKYGISGPCARQYITNAKLKIAWSKYYEIIYYGKEEFDKREKEKAEAAAKEYQTQLKQAFDELNQSDDTSIYYLRGLPLNTQEELRRLKIYTLGDLKKLYVSDKTYYSKPIRFRLNHIIGRQEYIKTLENMLIEGTDKEE